MKAFTTASIKEAPFCGGAHPSAQRTLAHTACHLAQIMSAATLFLVAITLHTVLSAPQQDGSKQATVVEQFNNFNGIDPWRWSYTLSDGSRREEEGEVVNGELRLSGTYAWKDPEGSVHEVNYIADKQGYRMAPEFRLGTNAGLSLIGR
ncbi:uncharacterized protein LOC126419519 [Schistocerca serialis cubense]|uniref:uncharacterized protein LOC126419519 n=1 Tax=Schistocerca serialis cubense TaxID=2023355 RepID=UPI00214EBF68|nr:uncharacterized protein LOC126419519 [Schistocerca serialis cubense]